MITQPQIEVMAQKLAKYFADDDVKQGAVSMHESILADEDNVIVRIYPEMDSALGLTALTKKNLVYWLTAYFKNVQGAAGLMKLPESALLIEREISERTGKEMLTFSIVAVLPREWAVSACRTYGISELYDIGFAGWMNLPHDGGMLDPRGVPLERRVSICAPDGIMESFGEGQ